MNNLFSKKIAFFYIRRTEIDNDKLLSTFIALTLLLTVVNITIKVTFPLSENMWRVISISFKGVLLLMFLRIIPVLFKRVFFFFLTWGIFFGALFLITYLRGTANQEVLTVFAAETILQSVTYMSCVYAIRDRRIFYNTMLKYSYYILAVSLVSLLSLGTSSSYQGSLTVYMAIAVLFQANELFKKKLFVNIFIMCFFSSIVLFYGSRRALFIIVFFIGVRLLKHIKISVTSFMKIVVLIVALTIMALNFDSIIHFISGEFDSSNKSSYIIRRLQSGGFFENSARHEIWNYYWGLIVEKPLLGWGMAGGIVSTGHHTHNAFLEFFLAFGIIGGGVLSVLLVISSIKTLLMKEKNGIDFELSLIYNAIIINSFFVSGKILQNYYAFIFLILCWTRSKVNVLTQKNI